MKQTFLEGRGPTLRDFQIFVNVDLLHKFFTRNELMITFKNLIPCKVQEHLNFPYFCRVHDFVIWKFMTSLWESKFTRAVYGKASVCRICGFQNQEWFGVNLIIFRVSCHYLLATVFCPPWNWSMNMKLWLTLFEHCLQINILFFTKIFCLATVKGICKVHS